MILSEVDMGAVTFEEAVACLVGLKVQGKPITPVAEGFHRSFGFSTEHLVDAAMRQFHNESRNDGK
jgi:hypothetical protein